MSTTPVLTLPDFQKKFVIKIDACKGGIGFVLMQENMPIVYLSKDLSSKHWECPLRRKKCWK